MTAPLRLATVSEDGRYRYTLHRLWVEAPPVVFIMLNPSTADADVDDPTIRRCVTFAQGWDAGGIVVVNLYAYRATDPTELAAARDAVGPANDAAIRELLDGQPYAVAAWGAGITKVRGGSARAATVIRIADDLGVKLRCLGTTAAGHPRHPLYVRGDTELVPFR